jgi:parallel beta-helix repeat protein
MEPLPRVSPPRRFGNNVISGNSQVLCSGGVGGAGVSIQGNGTVQLLNNVITGNTHDSGAGGVALFAAGTPTISGNVIKDNVGWIGGGMSLENVSDATITNNIIVRNQGAQGGGIYVSVPYGARGPLVVNNTVAADRANTGLAVYAVGFDAQATEPPRLSSATAPMTRTRRSSSSTTSTTAALGLRSAEPALAKSA